MENMPNNQVPPETPVVNQTPQPAEKNSIGPVVGSVIIIAILVLGAVYLWGEKIYTPKEVATPPSESVVPLSEKDEVGNLESDLLNTPDLDIEDLDLGI